MSYLDTLKNLIAGEAVCACQYKFAAENMKGGENYNYLHDHFTEHFDEEWDHYSKLTEALLIRDEEGLYQLQDTISSALPALKEISSWDCEDLREFFIDAEKNAVSEYTKFYKEIEESDADLADLILSIIQDEKAHKLDFTRVSRSPNFEDIQVGIEDREDREAGLPSQAIENLMNYNQRSFYNEED